MRAVQDRRDGRGCGRCRVSRRLQFVELRVCIDLLAQRDDDGVAERTKSAVEAALGGLDVFGAAKVGVHVKAIAVQSDEDLAPVLRASVGA